MPECGTFDLSCQASAAATSAFEGIARSAGEAAADLMGQSFTWWIDTESVNPDNPIVRELQADTMPVVLIMLVGSILVQSIRMMLTRKKDPAINVALGLIRYAAVSSAELFLLAILLRGGDHFSSQLIDQRIGDFSARMGAILGNTDLGGIFMLLVFSLIGLLLAAIQWGLALFRQAGILILSVMLLLAASGSINDSTKVWMSRLVPWLLTLVLCKPMAAMIYAIGFTMLGKGDDFTTLLTGFMVMVLAVVAMPAMLKFFAWSQADATGGSGTGGVLAAGASGAASIAALRSARSMQLTGPGSTPVGAADSGASGQLAISGSGGSAGGAAGAAAGGGPSGGGPAGGGSAGGGGSTGGSGPPSPGAGGGPPAAGGSTSSSGAAGAPDAGVPSARAGGGVPPATGGGSAASGAASAAAAAGGAAAAGAAAASAAAQAARAAADSFTDGGKQ